MMTRRSLFGLCLAPIVPIIPGSIHIERSLPLEWQEAVDGFVANIRASGVKDYTWMQGTELPGAKWVVVRITGGGGGGTQETNPVT